MSYAIIDSAGHVVVSSKNYNLIKTLYENAYNDPKLYRMKSFVKQ